MRPALQERGRSFIRVRFGYATASHSDALPGLAQLHDLLFVEPPWTMDFMSLTLNSMHALSLAFLIGFSGTGLLPAQTTTNSPSSEIAERSRNNPLIGWGVSLSGGYVHNFKTGIDSGGRFARDAALLQAGVRYAFTTNRSVTLSIGYGFENYDFTGNSGIGAMDPWSDLHTFRFGVPVFWGIDDRWSAFVIPTVRFQGESDARFADALSGGGFIGVSYRLHDRLTLGPGFGAVTQLEDSPSYFPLLIIDWKIAEKWSFNTGRGLGATLGPGFVLAYQPVDYWTFGIGARYERFRFRLNDERAVAPNGVGEDRSQPVFLTAVYSPNPGMSLSIIGGVQTGGELRIDDRNGDRIADSDYDTGGFAGFTVRFRF